MLRMSEVEPAKTTTAKPATELTRVNIRFAGDSGDGMQLTGGQFTLATAIAGNELATFPDFPAEIRAPPRKTDALPPEARQQLLPLQSA